MASKQENLQILAGELHKPAKAHYPRRKAYGLYNNRIWAADLVDVAKDKHHNKGYTFLLNIVDIHSRYAWSIPLTRKTGAQVLEALESLEVTPVKMWVDEGKEFYNQQVGKWATDNNVVIYSTHSGLKSVFVERFNRTLREGLAKYFTTHQTSKYDDYLDTFVSKYNNTVHSATKETPHNVYNNIKQSNEVIDTQKPKKSKFAVGDFVRLSKVKRTFEKGYTERYTYEVFEVTEIDDLTDPIMYKVKDSKGEEVTGKFYEQELQKTKIPGFKIIDSIVQRKKEGRRNMVLVSYKGHGSEFNEWMYQTDYNKLK